MLVDEIKKIKLTNTEKAIADYIVRNPKEVTGLTIEQLAEKTFTSKTTITRVCKKLRLKGFPELKMHIAEELDAFSIEDKYIQRDIPISFGEGSREVAKNIMNLQHQALMRTYHNLDLDAVYRAAQVIDQSDLVLLYGRGESLLALKNLQSDLNRIGKRSVCEMMHGFEFVYQFKERTKCCAVVVSQYLSSRYVNNTLLSLYEKNIPVILIHGTTKKPIIRKAAASISFDNSESYTKAGSFTSRLQKMYILNVLYSVLFSLHYDENVKAVRQYGKNVESWMDPSIPGDTK